MLFADCRGYTALVHERGPEAVKPIMDDFFRHCREAVVRYDGIVDHFLGDAVLALFNAPARHEDHASRAVKAAMDIQAAMQEVNANAGEEGLLQVGVGISTGLAYTGVVGSDNCSDYTALGDTVNIASRLQGEAAGGEVLVTEEVYEQITEMYPNAEERTLGLKGISERVHAYPLTMTP